MTRSRVPVNTIPASLGRRGGVRGTGAASGSPPDLADKPWLLDSCAVAHLLGIGRTKTFQLIASGELPSVRLGRCVRVPASALQSWIDARIAGSASAPPPADWPVGRRDA